MLRSRFSWRVALLATLSVAVLATAGLAQTEEEGEDTVQLMPNPLEHTGLTPPDVLAISRISKQTRVVTGRSYLPVADLARALGGGPPRPGDPGDPIHLQPGRNGLVKLNPAAPASRAAVIPRSTRGALSGVPPDDSLSSTTPDDNKPASLFIGGRLVSRGIIIINGMPMVPADDLAAALGAKIVYRQGGPAFEKTQGANGVLTF